MYRLFAHDLCQRVKVWNEQRAADTPEAMIEVRFLELYQQKVHDLLDEERKECFMREDAEGNVQLRGHTEKEMQTDEPRPLVGAGRWSRGRVVVRDIARKHVPELAEINE